MTVSAVPARDTTMELRDGRRLALAEWGKPGGRPIMLFEGAPGSRLFCPDVETTERLGIRLISPDRPGYGGSDPLPDRTLLDWAADVEALADGLGLASFPVIGWSSGGAYAMACGVALGDRLTSIATIAGDAPLDDVPTFRASLPPDMLARIDQIRADPVGARESVLERQRWYADDPGRIVRTALERGGADNPDAVLRSDPAIAAALDAMFREGARQGAAGLADDLIAYHRPWGFSPADVRQPTSVWWGEEDALTDRVHTESLAATIPGARLFIEPNEGHLLPVRHWARILAELERDP